MTASADFLPTETVPVVRLNPETHQRELVQLRWGLIPSWAKDPSIGSRLTYRVLLDTARKRGEYREGPGSPA